VLAKSYLNLLFDEIMVKEKAATAKGSYGTLVAAA